MTDGLLPQSVTQDVSFLRKQGLTAKQVQYINPDPARRLEVPAGPPAGLYLVVQTTGKKTWAYRYRGNGVTRKLTFKKRYPDMSLAAARAEGASSASDSNAARRFRERWGRELASLSEEQLGG